MLREIDIAVVIPSYQSAEWLPETLEALEKASRQLPNQPKVLIVDDGSTDATRNVIDFFITNSDLSLNVLRQENEGRFAARLAGARAIEASWLLFLDSRVRLGEKSLLALASFLQSHDEKVVAVNGLTVTEENDQFEGLFWEVPTKIFWGKAISSLENTAYSRENYEDLPKGTGLLLIQREVFLELCESYKNQGETRYQSDDTKLLRALGDKGEFWFVPSFSASYVPNAGIRKFVSHTFGRGIFFWDSFASSGLRMSAVKWAVLIAPPCAIAYLWFLIAIGQISLAWNVIGASIALLCVTGGLGAKMGASFKSVFSFLILLPLFLPIYWLGVVFGIYKRGKTSRQASARIQ